MGYSPRGHKELDKTARPAATAKFQVNLTFLKETGGWTMK